MVPEIRFRHSAIYDPMLVRPDLNFEMPADEVFARFINAYKTRWNISGHSIETSIAATTGLPWTDPVIICYITAGIESCFSDPLTIRLFVDLEDFIDVLTHELIHRNFAFCAYNPAFGLNWKTLMAQFKDEHEITRRHIPLHAVHTAVILTLYGQARLERTMARDRSPRYIRSWEIVRAEGYKKILAGLTRGVSSPSCVATE